MRRLVDLSLLFGGDLSASKSEERGVYAASPFEIPGALETISNRMSFA